MKTYEVKDLEKAITNGIVKGSFKCLGIGLGVGAVLLSGLFGGLWLINYYDEHYGSEED